MQPRLIDDTAPRFDSGVELEPRDHVRLGAQLQRVLAVMRDGKWHSVPVIRAVILDRFGVLDPEPSISAQIRNLKKAKHGSHVIERRRNSTWYEFRLVTGAR